MNQHLQQFAQQLAIWTEEIIEHGRIPFRRVDTYPEIDTEKGTIEPPLIFWINRQSMMAGGILLLPENNLEIELQRGRHLASALGLRNFVTWEANQARIWQIEKNEVSEQQSFPLSNPNHPETFRFLLVDILEALKLIAVLGAIPATDLSPYYFNNLFHTTLQQALPPLIEVYRSQRSKTDEHPTEDTGTDTDANEANRLLLLQVLSLLWYNKFPDAILPEKMDRAIELSLLTLPESVQIPLSRKATIVPPPLPLEAAVCFHHLLLRLRQLSWNQPTERAKASIRRLTESWYQNKLEVKEPTAIHLYPATPPLNASTKILLSSSPSFLAATALLADIAALPPRELLFGNLFQFDRDNLSNQPIVARLLNHRKIASFERREYTAKLRLSWPNRHLKVKTGQPFWHWELIHILGLCQPEQNLSLELPISLLKEPENILAWPLLCENYSFQLVKLLSNRNIQLDILRSKKSNEQFPLQREDEVREIAPSADLNRFRNQLLVALTLPKDIHRLLENELIWPDMSGIPDTHLLGWEIYSQSRLYKWLRTILSNATDSTDSLNDTAEETICTHIPYPNPLLLNELITFEKRSSAEDQLLSIDHFLADLLTCPALENIELPAATPPEKTGRSGADSEKKLRRTITQQLSTHGIPNFPEQYLYFLDQPEMCHYAITPPLVIKNSLLGEFELEDAKGQILAGYGEELKQALLFCSASGKTEIDLPSDRFQLEELLAHYQKDLKNLYKFLNDLCYSRVENSKSARKMVKKTWEKLNLPTPSWFNS